MQPGLVGGKVNAILASLPRPLPLQGEITLRSPRETEGRVLPQLREQVKDIEVGYSNSRTCEIGLQHNSGISYVSIIYLVNACTVPDRRI